MNENLQKNDQPHCALVWKTGEDGKVVDMRVLTPSEFLGNPKYKRYSWFANSPEGSKNGPSDKWGTAQVTLHGLEGLIFDVLSNCCNGVAPMVLQRVQVDLRRLGTGGWTKEYSNCWDEEHRQILNNAGCKQVS